MRKVIILLHLVCCSSIIWAQTKPKTNTQSSKPSKAFTIKYLNEKLNENCIGRFGEVWEEYLRYDADLKLMISDWKDYSVFIVDNYEIKEENGIPYLTITIRAENRRKNFHSGDGDDYDRFNNIVSTVPISKIKNIIPYDKPKKVEQEKKTYHKTESASTGIIFFTDGNNIIFNQLDLQKKDFISFQQIPNNNPDETEKIKKAFLNLKSYYKEEIDPFAQSEVTKKQEDKISFAQEIQHYDKVKLKSWILNTLNENSISAYSLSTTRSYVVNANHRFEIKNDILFYYSEDSLREYNGWKATTEFRSIYHILEVTIPLKDIDIGELNLGGNARGEGIDFYKDVNTFYGTHGDDVTFLTMIAKGLKNSFNVRVTEFKNGNKIEGMPKDIPAQMQYIPINLSKEKVENLKTVFDKLQTEL